MTIREALKMAAGKLKKSKLISSSYDLDALILLKFVLNKDDLFILLNSTTKIEEHDLNKFNDLINKRKDGCPIAYITHHKEFYGLDFYVDESVLIPRPETELLVDTAIKYAEKFEHPKIIDIGTGSGCAAIALSILLNSKIFASDISLKALKIAEKNAGRLNAQLEFICSDKLLWLNKSVDIIVSNPPYIKESDYNSLQKEIEYEPKNALIAKKNGTAVISDIIMESKEKCSYLIVEIGYDQKEFVESFNQFKELIYDYSNLPRVAVFDFT